MSMWKERQASLYPRHQSGHKFMDAEGLIRYRLFSIHSFYLQSALNFTGLEAGHAVRYL